jgi:poly-D-alanine transfer protein DltD
VIKVVYVIISRAVRQFAYISFPAETDPDIAQKKVQEIFDQGFANLEDLKTQLNAEIIFDDCVDSDMDYSIDFATLEDE